MRRLPPSTAWLLILTAGAAAGCAHQAPPVAVGPAQHFQSEATKIGGVKFEDDFIEARLIFQALPVGVPERSALRQSLLHYLLDPVVALSSDQLKREVRDLENDDIYDRIFDSFRDSLALFDPSELWAADPRSKITPVEQDLMGRTAHLVVAVFSPRGADSQVALALAVLATIDPTSREWPDRLSELIRWTEDAGNGGDPAASAGRRRRPTCSRAPFQTGLRRRWRARSTPSTPTGSGSSCRCCASLWAVANRRARRSAICCWRTATRCSARSSTSPRCTCTAG